jgi:integrase
MLRRGFKTKKEAEAAMVEAQNGINKGTYVEPSKILYSEFMKSYLDDKKTNVKMSTLSTYVYLVDNFILLPWVTSNYQRLSLETFNRFTII